MGDSLVIAALAGGIMIGFVVIVSWFRSRVATTDVYDQIVITDEDIADQITITETDVTTNVYDQIVITKTDDTTDVYDQIVIK